MGVIFDRISRLIKSNVSSYQTNSYRSILNSDDEELRRIIEELESGNSSTNGASGSQNNFNGSANSNVNSELQKAYSTLGLKFGASKEEIKSAYIKLVKLHHPDKVHKNDEKQKEIAHKKTLEINHAYNLISKAL